MQNIGTRHVFARAPLIPVAELIHGRVKSTNYAMNIEYGYEHRTFRCIQCNTECAFFSAGKSTSKIFEILQKIFVNEVFSQEPKMKKMIGESLPLLTGGLGVASK